MSSMSAQTGRHHSRRPQCTSVFLGSILRRRLKRSFFHSTDTEALNQVKHAAVISVCWVLTAYGGYRLRRTACQPSGWGLQCFCWPLVWIDESGMSTGPLAIRFATSGISTEDLSIPAAKGLSPSVLYRRRLGACL